jgi:hypothetical protein
MAVASPDEVARALERSPAPDDWAGMAPGILPIFERRRPFPFDVGRPIRTILPPGVSVSIAYDNGPALIRVTDRIAGLWPVSEEAIVERAMANLRDRAAAATDGPRPIRVVAEWIHDIPIRALVSGDGWASTLLLMPDLLERLFGRDACLFIAPMRDLLVALPTDIDIELATWLADELEALDPNCLCLEAFPWLDGRLTIRPLSREAVTA